MPVRKKDRSFARRHLFNFVLFGILLVDVGLFTFIRPDWFFATTAVGIVVLVVGLIRQHRLQSHYRCPQCRANLPCSSEGDPKPIEFHCAHCDIIWETGMVESSESGG